MKTLQSLETISDGRVYSINDMVKADADGCEGCYACCVDVGELVQLNPYDIFEIKKALGMSYGDLVDQKIEIRREGKIGLPHLKMASNKRCSFLNCEDRCDIHDSRPGTCRLFPLGRIYEEEAIQYFLQVSACTKDKLNKIKVKKWLGIPNYKKNEQFLLEWYHLIKALEFRMKFVRDEEAIQRLNKLLIQNVYDFDISKEDDFYEIISEKMNAAKEALDIL